ncbi:amino acid ABC transporter substrate-binding protein [Pseudoalteromonas sp. MMG013]|uniref:amino acid ABC transporter substrate-binding protein n=1 Tax=Pseudoalteromonas sp. MMG013 TaxID=2822687 RepID=UPI001B36502A|nr:amino acid ABC transporter substrate-binding protein [Pseudoalteromonas sp. MMG013]MBQ4860129.1 amino acid ABC transporter substrate-binding protein [Pseudoalteromonas sp. MMG013]
MLLRWLVSLAFVAVSPFSYGVNLTFCYEDKELSPAYMGNGQAVPRHNPGAAIEILRRADAQIPQVSFTYVRKPWQRCLHELKKNKVNAVIASYRTEREAFMVYPFNADGSVNSTVAISRFGRCIVGKEALYQHIQARNKALSLAIPSGYSAASSIDTKRFAIVNTSSQTEAYDLVMKDVVDGSIGLCLINGEKVRAYPYSQELVSVYPPFDMSYGFLTFSKEFFTHNSHEINLIWSLLGTMPVAEFYMEYLEMDDDGIE